MNNRLFTYLFILLASISFLMFDMVNSSSEVVFSNLLSFLNGERFNIIVIAEFFLYRYSQYLWVMSFSKIKSIGSPEK